jgi:hypothetical protein
MFRFLLLASVAGCLAAAPLSAAAQEGGYPVQTTAKTQFLMQNGEVVRRDGGQITSLTQNVKLSNGVKINYKSGIVEMPADKINPKGKKITLREGDYVRPDGGVVFATPGSAAAARGDAAAGTPAANGARYDTYVQRGPGFSDPAIQMGLLQKKVELLTQKVQLLSQGRTDMPDTKSIDDQLTQINSQLNSPK